MAKIMAIQVKVGGVEAMAKLEEGEDRDTAFNELKDWATARATELDSALVNRETARGEMEEEIRQEVAQSFLQQVLSKGKTMAETPVGQAMLDHPEHVYKEGKDTEDVIADPIKIQAQLDSSIKNTPVAPAEDGVANS